MPPNNETPKWNIPLKDTSPSDQGPKIEWKLPLRSGQVKTEIGINSEIPITFRESAYEAMRHISFLDKNPEEAIKDPKINRFVSQLAKTGFVGGVHMRYRSARWRGPDPEKALPKWLHEDFLRRHALDRPADITPAEEREVEELFELIAKGLPFHDGRHGRYYEVEKESIDRDIAQEFKYYLESKVLLGALRSGKLKQIMDVLAEQNISPVSFKLFDANRLVLYFQQPIESSSQVVHIFEAANVKGRGPAQDICEIVQEDGRVALKKTDCSNDAALGDGGRNPVVYNEALYDSKIFLETYLKLCLFRGKNPAEPYKTSFVYFMHPKGKTIEKAVADIAQSLTIYPILVVPSRILSI